MTQDIPSAQDLANSLNATPIKENWDSSLPLNNDTTNFVLGINSVRSPRQYQRLSDVSEISSFSELEKYESYFLVSIPGLDQGMFKINVSFLLKYLLENLKFSVIPTFKYPEYSFQWWIQKCVKRDGDVIDGVLRSTINVDDYEFQNDILVTKGYVESMIESYLVKIDDQSLIKKVEDLNSALTTYILKCNKLEETNKKILNESQEMIQRINDLLKKIEDSEKFAHVHEKISLI